MLTKVKNPSTMKKLYKIFPVKSGRKIIKTINHAIIDQNGELKITENKLEKVKVDKHEMLIRVNKKINPPGSLHPGVQINIEEIYVKL